MYSRDPTRSPAWSRLHRIARETQSGGPRKRVNDPVGLIRRPLEVHGLIFDWSCQLIDDRAFEALLDLARERKALEQFQAQLSGGTVNRTEGRAALHTALRGTNSSLDETVSSEITNQQADFLEFAESVKSGQSCGFKDEPFTDVLAAVTWGLNSSARRFNAGIHTYTSFQTSIPPMSTKHSPHCGPKTHWSSSRQNPFQRLKHGRTSRKLKRGSTNRCQSKHDANISST